MIIVKTVLLPILLFVASGWVGYTICEIHFIKRRVRWIEEIIIEVMTKDAKKNGKN